MIFRLFGSRANRAYSLLVSANVMRSALALFSIDLDPVQRLGPFGGGGFDLARLLSRFGLQARRFGPARVLPGAGTYAGAKGAAFARVSNFFKASCFSFGSGSAALLLDRTATLQAALPARVRAQLAPVPAGVPRRCPRPCAGGHQADRRP
jgi:hypothetical protein